MNEWRQYHSGAEGARYISQCLATNTTVTSLNLEKNEIGAEGALYLSQCLAINTTLRSLDLRVRSRQPTNSTQLHRSNRIKSLTDRISRNTVGERSRVRRSATSRSSRIIATIAGYLGIYRARSRTLARARSSTLRSGGTAARIATHRTMVSALKA